jgi:hypothetical protein
VSLKFGILKLYLKHALSFKTEKIVFLFTLQCYFHEELYEQVLTTPNTLIMLLAAFVKVDSSLKCMGMQINGICAQQEKKFSKLCDPHHMDKFSFRGFRGKFVLCHCELYNLYSSPNTIRMIKSNRMRWTGNLARWGEEECVLDFGGKARRKETTRET